MRNSYLPLTIVGLFLAAHAFVPLVWGDIYPFTSAPMFRDKPERYCNYHVFAPDGTELPQEDWLVQRVYDGNPVGYGVGVTPPAVIEQEFGIVHDEAEIREHVARQFSGEQGGLQRVMPYVDVVQEAFGPGATGEIERRVVGRWRIDNPTRERR